MSEQVPLLRVCSLLNSHGARYLIVGARACWLHGYVRATMDVDILIPEDLENHARIIAALGELEDHAAAELTPQDLVENVVVKIADEVEVPYVDLQTLIKSKSTGREQDKVDVRRLLSLSRPE